MTSKYSSTASSYLERLAAELDVPPSRYEEARKRYKSVGEWLDREESTLKDFAPEVYVQGSFRLGTPIRPINEDEHYDIDLVCELAADKGSFTQQQLKALLGHEMALYAKRHGMKDLAEGRRCWTLEYAEGAQFHLDALPAIPDGEKKRARLIALAMNTEWSETAIAITDVEHPAYDAQSVNWPHSNPRGYTEWFRSRMREAFERQRSAMALEARASVEDVPSYRVKTPLQQAVQILKRHRDVMFADDTDDKPISVIITTLAGHAYANEASVAYALDGILARMDSSILTRNGAIWIPNPTDPEENFADRWKTHPQRKEKFFKWLRQARQDFTEILTENRREFIAEAASRTIGASVARNADASLNRPPATVASLFQRATSVFSAVHKKAAPWLFVKGGRVVIDNATYLQRGYRKKRLYQDGPALPKNVSLEFRAKTDVPEPFNVYWQVVNTGPEAAAVQGGLRGGFDAGAVEKGSIVRSESTSYSGKHSIECFIVKNGYLVARSGAFIVNIQ